MEERGVMLEEHLQQGREVGLGQEPVPLGGRPACEPGNSVRREGRQTGKDLSLDWREKSLETGPGCLP